MSQRDQSTSKRSLVNLRRLLKYWQPRLRLADWMIDVSWATDEELDGDALGRVTWHFDSKVAKIQILHPKEPQDTLLPPDLEATLVHELVHLHLITWNTRNDLEEKLQEQAIEAVTGALLGLKRRKK